MFKFSLNPRRILTVSVVLMVLLPSASAETAGKKTTKKRTPSAPVTKPPLVETSPAVVEPTRAERAPSATIEPEALAEFAAQPPRVQQLITASLALTKLNLTYTFGSADPAKGGMDCSGTIFRVLNDQGFTDVPRDSSGQYSWLRKNGTFFSVVSKTADGFEFSDLQPGDLLFWTGTYETSRDVPISHVMLYLGREKKSGRRVMFGASDGRSYAGIQRWGVSVFDFKMPKADPARPERRADFVGYGRIPGLRAKAEAPTVTAVAPEEKPVAASVKPPVARKKSSTKKVR